MDVELAMTPNSDPDQHKAWCVTTPVRRPEGTDVLRSVSTALDVLDCFARDSHLGVSEIAQRLGIAKSTAHRMLATLVSRGLVERTGDGRYELGLHLHELGQLAQARHTLRHRAMGTLRALSQQSGLAVMLCVADGPDVVAVDRVEPSPLIPPLTHLGPRFPSHCTSAGKVLAAYDASVAQARSEAGFLPRTPHAPHNRVEWERTLSEVRRKGYAHSRDEFLPGVSSVAVPLFDVQRRVVAALLVLDRTQDVNLARRMLPSMIAAARRVGMGDRPARMGRLT